MPHTPGPWKFDNRTCYGKSLDPVERRANGELIPQLTPVVLAVTEASISHADRALIAAAPDLLAACREFLAEHREQVEALGWNWSQYLADERDGYRGAGAAARAIAKATGEAVQP